MKFGGRLGMKSKTVLLMIISTLAFAGVNAIIKYLDRFGEFQLVFFRSIVSLSITIVQLKVLKLSPWGNNKPVLLLRGVAGVSALIMGFVLIKNVPLGTAITLNYLSPIFTAIIATFWLKERIKPTQWLFLLLCVVGVWSLKNGEISLTFEMLLLGLGASSFAGLAYTCVRVCKETDHPLVVVFWFPFVSTPISLVLIFLFQNWYWPSNFEWCIILLLGILTQIAQIALTKALQQDKAANAAILKYLGVVHAFLIGWFFFGEGLNLQSALGVLVVLLGIILFGWSKKRRQT